VDIRASFTESTLPTTRVLRISDARDVTSLFRAT
jgi:hypothetical protein